MPIIKVTDKEGNVRAGKAKTKHSAINRVVGDTYTAEIVSAEKLLELIQAGVIIEDWADLETPVAHDDVKGEVAEVAIIDEAVEEVAGAGEYE